MEIGTFIGVENRYEVVDILGKGGMGTVVKAYDNMLKEFVAIKTLHERLIDNNDIKNRFLNEAKICLNITHPNIIRVRDVNIHNNVYFMVMEYLEGVDLKYWMRDKNTDEPSELYALIRPIFEALEYAHTFTIHRDIKPANIMLQNGKAYLMDFGISKALETSEIVNETVIGAMGTRSYMAPEQAFNASDVDKRCDIYSMGILFYELLTEQKPENTAIKDALAPSILNNKITKELDKIILKMINAKPEHRFNDMQEIIVEVDKVFYTSNDKVFSQTIEIETNTTTIDNLENMIQIPEGFFFRGSGIESKVICEKPRKKVYIDEFYICKYPVTNKEYSIFIENTAYPKPIDFNDKLTNFPNHPVVNVSQLDALAYCKFIGATLPTEAQWEKVAKGGKNLVYTWGKEFKDNYANIDNINNVIVDVQCYEKAINEYGIYQLAGNIWEWCLDDYIEDFYKNSSLKNPIALNNSDDKVVRGGSFDFIKDASRTSFRYKKNMNLKDFNIGFRIVYNG